MIARIQLRNDTASAWTLINPVLAQGEIGVESDTLKQKIGDGTTVWNSLSYSSEPIVQIPAMTIKGNDSISTELPQDLTVAEVQTMIQDTTHRFVTDTQITQWDSTSAVIKYYETQTLAISDEANIVVGNYIQTFGAVSINDGDGSLYIVEATLKDGFTLTTGKHANNLNYNTNGYVTKFTGATGTVTIPSGLPIGTRKLIRKLNATQGKVSITCSGETFEGRSTIYLNYNIDFWLVEKISATVWSLLEGYERGNNSFGFYTKLPDSTMRQQATQLGVPVTYLPAGALFATPSMTLQYPEVMVSVRTVLVDSQSANNWGSATTRTVSECGIKFWSTSSTFSTVNVKAEIVGTW